MKVITLGNGFIANHLPYDKYIKHLPIDYGSGDEESSTFEGHVLDKYEPDVVINCIGKTGRPNVDWCESNQIETYLTNTVLPSILAASCAKRNIHFIHIGSGCIYFGKSPNESDNMNKKYDLILSDRPKIDSGWKENDFANSQSFYSKTKYACDLAIGELPNVTSLRIRMPVSTKNDQRNFINKVAGYQRVIDIPNSITMMDDLVRCIDWVIKNKIYGIYHVTNPEPLTATQIMREYQKYKADHIFEVMTGQELDSITIAKRSNCILDISKLKNAGFQMSPSKAALENCMQKYFGDLDVE